MALRGNEDLHARMQALLGYDEVLLDAGWGAVGARNVFIGVTETRLILEYVTISLKTKRIDEIPFDQLDALEVRKGDSTIPRWARINIESAIVNALTTSLIIRKTGERSIHINFRSIPRFEGNRNAGVRLAEIIGNARPDIPSTVDLSSERKQDDSTGMRVLKAAIITGFLFAVPLAFAGGFYGALGGALSGAVVGGVFSLFWPALKRTLTGRE